MGMKWRGSQKFGFLRLNMTQKGISSISERYGPFTRNSRADNWRLDLPLGFHYIFGPTGNAALDRIRGTGALVIFVTAALLFLGVGYTALMMWLGWWSPRILLLPLIAILIVGAMTSKPRPRRR